jgi:hypothetical protein
MPFSVRTREAQVNGVANGWHNPAKALAGP